MQVAFSSDSIDSNDVDDARRFHREWNAVVDHYFEATQHNGQLEFAQSASQITLSTTEAEANVAWAQLAESDTRVTGKIFNHPGCL